MSVILHIETSTDCCSVAVSENGANIFNVEDFEGPFHATKLGTMVDEALSFTDNHGIPFDAVAVSCGPGSYTGLRIGVSMAKGICYARDLKLIEGVALSFFVPFTFLKPEGGVSGATFCGSCLG